MQIPTIEPKIAAMPGFVTMEHCCGWRMLSDIFSHYDLNVLRKELWQMYKSAILEKEGMGKKVRRRHFTSLFEAVNDVATASYLLYGQKGYEIHYQVDTVAAYFPIWQRFECSPYSILFNVFKEFELDDLRSELWDLYKTAITNNSIYHRRRDKYEVIFLFERLNDLVTAAYVITKEKYQSNLQ